MAGILSSGMRLALFSWQKHEWTVGCEMIIGVIIIRAGLFRGATAFGATDGK